MEPQTKTEQPIYSCYHALCEWSGNHPNFEDSIFALCPACGGEVAVIVDFNEIPIKEEK